MNSLFAALGSNTGVKKLQACLQAKPQETLVYGLANAGHSIAQTLGGVFGIPHGPACGYTLPWIMEFNTPGAPRLCKMCGEAMGLKFAADATEQNVFAAQRMLARDLKILFDEKGVEIPFPQVVVHRAE